MATASVTVEGGQALARELRAKGATAQHQRETLEQVARKTARGIRGVPVDTGRLEKSVHGGPDFVLQVDDEHFVIGSAVPYARFVFKGTQYVEARPPKVPDYGPEAARAISADIAKAR